MRAILLAMWSIGTYTSSAGADAITDNFALHLTQASLNALSKDLGTLMGGGSFHGGKPLGFPIGLDVGVHAPIINARKDNRILLDNGRTHRAIWGQAEMGLPAKLGLIFRSGRWEDAQAWGTGLRQALYKSGTPMAPSISISALYNQMKHQNFRQFTYSGNAVFSFDWPYLDPYVGGGFETSTLEPRTGTSLKGKSNGIRAEVGINVHFAPFTYLNIGWGWANGEQMYHTGAGGHF